MGGSKLTVNSTVTVKIDKKFQSTRGMQTICLSFVLVLVVHTIQNDGAVIWRVDIFSEKRMRA